MVSCRSGADPPWWRNKPRQRGAVAIPVGLAPDGSLRPCRRRDAARCTRIRAVDVWKDVAELALCSVLSRSNSQVRSVAIVKVSLHYCRNAKRPLPGASRVNECRGRQWLFDHGADAVVGQDLEQQRVFDTAVDDMHALDAVRAASSAPNRSSAACRRRGCRPTMSSICFGVMPVMRLPALSSTPGCWSAAPAFLP